MLRDATIAILKCSRPLSACMMAECCSLVEGPPKDLHILQGQRWPRILSHHRQVKLLTQARLCLGDTELASPAVETMSGSRQTPPQPLRSSKTDSWMASCRVCMVHTLPSRPPGHQRAGSRSCHSGKAWTLVRPSLRYHLVRLQASVQRRIYIYIYTYIYNMAR